MGESEGETVMSVNKSERARRAEALAAANGAAATDTGESVPSEATPATGEPNGGETIPAATIPAIVIPATNEEVPATSEQAPVPVPATIETPPATSEVAPATAPAATSNVVGLWDSDPAAWKALSPGVKAAQRRAFNASGGATIGTAKAKPESAAASPMAIVGGTRSAGMCLQFWIKCEAERITFSFVPVDEEGKFWPAGLAVGERGLPNLRWEARPDLTQDGELSGFNVVNIWLKGTTGDLERALPMMQQVDRIVARAREDTEDLSIGLVASTLVAHFKVVAIHVRDPEGMEKLHKRGSAYVVALRAGDALIERHRTAEAEKAKLAAD